jgi:hypothetical protein
MSEAFILAVTLTSGLGIATVLIATTHHGSAESRDGEDRIEEAVRRIERRLDEAGIGSPAS